MKKLLFSIAAGVMLFTSCTKTDLSNQTVANEEEFVAPSQRRCASSEVLEAQLKADPNLRRRMDEVESFTKRFAANRSNQRLSLDTMIIPVVVNVLYRTTAENISLAQIQSQIDVLNADFSGKNSDVSKVPTLFAGVKALDTKVRFVLETVVRKSTTKKAGVPMML